MKKTLVLLSLCVLSFSCSPTGSEDGAPVPLETLEVEATVLGPGTVASFDGEEIAFTVHRVDVQNLVLVHGWMCDQTYWEHQAEVLAEAFGVVTVDLAGHGLSGSSREEWTTVSLGEDVKAVIEKLELERVVVVGHSMGGRVGLEVARLLPQTVIGVVGVDTLQKADNEMDPKQAQAIVAEFEQDFDTNCETFVRSMFGENADAALIDRVTADMCAGPGTIGVALLRNYFAYDVRGALQAAGVPVRCINADKWPTDTEGNQEYADFEATILSGFGHFLMQEAPDELEVALIDTILDIVSDEGPLKK
ncbi:MAG: alpha/beta hydrolase [Thermoanaerobaculales bacterium]|nr:alpha/beta hydrolase [Thermoanaerobaculales bacterium]